MEDKTSLEKAAQFAGAMWNWAKIDGLKVVDKTGFDSRKEICSKCEHWNQAGFGGMGQCKVCGCSGAKLYIPSSRCPLGKWLNVESSGSVDKSR